VTYSRIVATIRPQKAETHRVRLTVGGDRLDYPGNTSTPTASQTTAKVLINSTISTDDARFGCIDLKDFYLGTPMTRYEYMRLHLDIIPQEIVDQYKLKDITTPDGWVYIEIRRGMYGLNQAGIIAYQQLKTHLATYDYYPVKRTPSLWRHHTCSTAFCLIVDNFGVKYVGKANFEHLEQALSAKYTCSTDWTGLLYCGLTIKWNYQAQPRHVDVSMPGYISTAQHKFQHPTPKRPQDSPHVWNQPVYGSKIQCTPDADTSPCLEGPAITRIQKVIGTLLFYGIAVDPTLLVALGSIASEQSTATENTKANVHRLFNYAPSHPNATIRYYASGMVLHIHSDASYLSEPKSHSRAGGHFFLSDMPTDPTKGLTKPRLNGPIHTVCHIMRNVMASAAESKAGALFSTAKRLSPCVTL
jgi:hypothetical protein